MIFGNQDLTNYSGSASLPLLRPRSLALRNRCSGHFRDAYRACVGSKDRIGSQRSGELLEQRCLEIDILRGSLREGFNNYKWMGV